MADKRQLATGFAAAAAALFLFSTGAAALESCAVVADAASGDTLFREGPCDRRVTPASTFKIPIALMGYDAGILLNEHEPRWDYQPGFPVNSKCDRETVDPPKWETCSVVWYSQEITTRLGMERFRDYVDRFDYGNRDVSGAPGQNNGLTHAWLVTSLQISADEEIRFLRRFLDGALPASKRAHEMAAAILPVFHANGGWTVHGKTGGGRVQDAERRADPDRPLGWFVGWADKDGRRVVFARLLISGGAPEAANGILARAALLAELDGMVSE